jgi:hypothetical protein
LSQGTLALQMDANRRLTERHTRPQMLPGKKSVQPGKLPAVRSARGAPILIFYTAWAQRDIVFGRLRHNVSGLTLYTL